jgi:hypothetical protein
MASNKANLPVVDRQLVTFFCFAKKKVTQEKATHSCTSLRLPSGECLHRTAAELARSATRPRAQTVLAVLPPMETFTLSGADGDENPKSKIQNPKPKTKPHTKPDAMKRGIRPKLTYCCSLF